MTDLKIDRGNTDHVVRATDHDLLIKLHTKMDDVCASHTETRKEVKLFADKIDARCETRLSLINTNHDSIVGKPMFKWLFGMLVLSIITLYSVVTINAVTTTKNELQINQNSSQIKSNIAALHALIKRGD